MKKLHKLLAVLIASGAVAHAQVEPAATGPASRPIGRSLQYSLGYKQSAEFGGALGDWDTSAVNGDLHYSNGVQRLPFNVDYLGAYTWTLSGPSYYTGLSQSMWMTQGFIQRHWRVTLTDGLNYRPQPKNSFLFGVPGTGGGSLPSNEQSILTIGTHTVYNNVSGSVDLDVGSSHALSFGGGEALLRYPDGNGLNTDSAQASAGFATRLNARNSVSGQYLYSHFFYPDYSFSFDTHTIFFSNDRQWNRKLSTSLAAGPEFVRSSNSAILPGATKLAVNSFLDYKRRSEAFTLRYNRATRGGSGYLFGSEIDSVTGILSATFRRRTTAGIIGAYSRTTGVKSAQAINSVITGAEATRLLGRYLTLVANFDVIDQMTHYKPQSGVLNHQVESLTFGIKYSPRGAPLPQ
jgi:hypothetical protein